jgi:hypothetical protein
MITYGEVKQSPSGWEDMKMSFQSDLTTLIEQYRNTANKLEISKILVGAAEIVEKDEGWIFDEVNVQPVSPTLTALTPNTAVVGAADLTLVATGTDFTENSVIVFGGAEETTTFTDATSISCVIEPSSAVAGAVPVLVRTSTLESAPLDFTFTAAE